MKLVRVALTQALESKDAAASHVSSGQETRALWLPIDMYDACTARAYPTAELWAVEHKMITQYPKQPILGEMCGDID